MIYKKKHIEKQPDLSKESLEMISRSYIDWGKSKDQVWLELEKKLELSEPVSAKVIMNPWIRIAMAAALALLVGLAVFMQLYTKTIRVPAGQHSDLFLPDQSLVHINAQSTLSFRPLLWKFSRHVKFEGEACFKVEKGKTFEVVSDEGTTRVLGTTFNVYARYDDYQVTCVSGKVQVTEARSKDKAILLAGQKASLNPSGILEIQSGVNTEQTLSWLNNMLSFTSKPLSKVFEEIGRQYNILIFIPGDLDNTYTGTFRRDTSVENTLNLVCRPFNLSFTRKSKNEYVISRND
ncbi:MAG: FecR domain-containing protein [Bacteroidales bacterium]|nr:FecR domain-containing protein [Bacteroidales bacterium]